MQTIKEESLSVTEVEDDVTIFTSEHTSHYESGDNRKKIWVEAEDCTCGAERIYQCTIAGKKYALVIPGCTAFINHNTGFVKDAISQLSEYTGYKLITEDQVHYLIEDCCGDNAITVRRKIREMEREGESEDDDCKPVEPIIEYGFNREIYVARDILRLIKKLYCFADKCSVCNKRKCDDSHCRRMASEKSDLFHFTKDTFDSGFVYFILGQMSGHIKIGYTSKNNRDRIRDHKRDQWNDNLKMFAMIKGSTNLESYIHDDLYDYKVPGRRRDVFFYTNNVKNYIDNLLKICEHAPNETELVEWFNSDD